MTVAFEDGMMLILYGIMSILIRIKGIKAISRDVCIGDPVHEHQADSAWSIYLLVAYRLNVQPVGPRALRELSTHLQVAGLIEVLSLSCATWADLTDFVEKQRWLWPSLVGTFNDTSCIWSCASSWKLQDCCFGNLQPPKNACLRVLLSSIDSRRDRY